MKGRSSALTDRFHWAYSALPLLDALGRRAAFAIFARLESGTLTVVEGDERSVFGRPDGLAATLVIHDAAAYRAFLFRGSVGAGEAYMDGLWNSDDPDLVTRLFARNADVLADMDRGPSRIPRLAVDAVTGVLRRNTRAGSRRNIAKHYDLSNELFALFLDDSMTYSSGIFASPNASLEEAQATKIERVCQKLDLRPGDHLLEIGTGWGALAMHAAEQYGCRVTTTTVSVEQHREATKRVRARGLETKVEVLLSDYRDLRGVYDKVVSIEMVEAVGHEYLAGYLRTASDRLGPNGLALFQAITIADQRHDAHRASIDFIKEYIFPGSCLPSVTSLVDAATRATDLRLVHLEDLTPHYARTLRLWRERLRKNASQVRLLGFDDRFIRMWEFYLAYCEGGFRERYLGSVHMMFAKPGNRAIPSIWSLE